MNNMLLTKSQTWLTELGIRSELSGTCLKVNRDDVVNFCNDDTKAATEILNGLKEAVSTKLFWGGKDDDYLFLESF